MNTLLLDPKNDKNAIKTAAKLINEGELVAIPTETVYGLGVNALNGNAVSRIFAAKGRPQDNPLIVHISSFDEIYPLVKEVPENAKKLADAFWPGPLTMILKKSDLIPAEVSANLDTVGIRMPSHPVAKQIIKEAGVPIAAPSANLSGKPSTTTSSHVLNDMNGKIAAVVEGGKCSVGVESTVISLVSTPPRLLRPGGISYEQLQSVLGDVSVDKALYTKIADTEKVSAPGMKYRHYAPKAPVTVICGKPELTAKYIETHLIDSCGVLCFDEYKGYFPCENTISYGSFENISQQAQNIFDALRKFDNLPVNAIYAQCPNDDGIGLAVSNRLKKAAGFNVIKLPDIMVIGITGGTGSGKSFVSTLFNMKNILTVDADKIYHNMLEKDADMLFAIRTEFGNTIFDKNGKLIRKALGAIVFNDKDKLKKLSDITSPYISGGVMSEFDKLACAGHKACLFDAPTLFESGFDKICTYILSVLAQREKRIERIIQRDGLTEDYATARVDAQPSDDFYKTRSNFIIQNNSDETNLSQAVSNIYDNIIKEL